MKNLCRYWKYLNLPDLGEFCFNWIWCGEEGVGKNHAKQNKQTNKKHTEFLRYYKSNIHDHLILFIYEILCTAMPSSFFFFSICLGHFLRILFTNFYQLVLFTPLVSADLLILSIFSLHKNRYFQWHIFFITEILAGVTGCRQDCLKHFLLWIFPSAFSPTYPWWAKFLR